ncbi:MAG: hypothetical protein ABIK73_07250 [candidate division WOR-3 bacterium]
MAVVGLMIGTAITAQTYTTVNSTAPSATLSSVNTAAGSALTTAGNFLPVIVIAGIGGLALFYLITFMRPGTM